MKVNTKAAGVMLITLWILLPLLFACGANKFELQRRERAMRDLGLEYLRDGDSTKALQKLLEAEDIYAEDPILQWYLGKAYFAKGENELAIKHLKRAIELKSDFGPAINDLGVVYLDMENYDAAIAQFKQLTGKVLYATPHFPLSNLGYAYYQKQEYRNSVHYYLKALELAPDYPIALRGLGRTYVAMGRGEEAVAALTVAIEKQPEVAESYFYLGKAYVQVRDFKKAKAAFEKTVAVDSDTPYAREARRYLQRLRGVAP
jgi:Tfp pilus assembly protein PilF